MSRGFTYTTSRVVSSTAQNGKLRESLRRKFNVCRLLLNFATREVEYYLALCCSLCLGSKGSKVVNGKHEVESAIMCDKARQKASFRVPARDPGGGEGLFIALSNL